MTRESPCTYGRRMISDVEGSIGDGTRRVRNHRPHHTGDGAVMARPKGSKNGQGYVVNSKHIAVQRLSCKRCDIFADLRISDDPADWPQHKCRATRKAEPFTCSNPVPPIPVREWSDDELKRETPPPNLGYLMIGQRQ